jgi:uncharacterized protein (DUF1330 family)
MLKSALLVTASMVVGAGAVQLLHAAGSSPLYTVAEINVKDRAAYEKDLPDAMKLIKDGAGVYLAGGFEKAKADVGAPPPNRFVIIRYDGGADAYDKVWNGGLKAWTEKHANIADFRIIRVEGVEAK